VRTIIALSVLLLASLVTIPTMAFASVDDNGFTMGYGNGMAQGQIDRQAKVFHIGTVCVGQTEAWCNGYTSGYLDGFFATLPFSSSHTTITVHEEGGHHGGHGGKHGGCGSGNTTNTCPPPPCKKDCPGSGPPPAPKGNETK
jgi:hypothetical protein